MKLYEINTNILELANQIVIDEETGEILCDYDAICDQIHALQMERRSVLSYLAKLVLNLRAESAALKTEEERLKQRRERLQAREDRLIHILDRECDGETTDLGVATLSYRKTSRLEVSDEAKAVSWLKRHKFTSAFKVPAPTVYKSEVRKLLSQGNKVPGCQVVDDRSISLK